MASERIHRAIDKTATKICSLDIKPETVDITVGVSFGFTATTTMVFNVQELCDYFGY